MLVLAITTRDSMAKETRMNCIRSNGGLIGALPLVDETISPYQAIADSPVLSVSVIIARPDIIVGSSPNAFL
jgi:hypothetical protein